MRGQATLTLQLECSNSTTKSAWLAPSKLSSIWLPGSLDRALQIESQINTVGSF
jgi:hypothetical protein